MQEHIIKHYQTAKEALNKLNSLASNKTMTLLVLDDSDKVLGTLTDGDIRRGLITDNSLDNKVEIFMNQNFFYLRQNEFSLEKIREIKDRKLHLIPVLDEVDKLVEIVDLRTKKSILPIDAVIMAGGKGTRLRPLTEKVPKPLLKVGDKPIIEYNIDRLGAYSIHNIHISIKYLGHQLIDYFGNGEDKGLNIQYIEENEPLGTIGAVGLVESFQQDYVLVMNSDLLTNIDYEDFFKEMLNKEADMMMATIPYEVKIPYAVIETQEDRITAFQEKPTYTYYSNAGIYIIKKSMLKYIPKNDFFNATDLVETLIQKGHKVGYYPILGYWLDIGKPQDFEKAQKDIQHIKF